MIPFANALSFYMSLFYLLPLSIRLFVPLSLIFTALFGAIKEFLL